MGFFFSEIKKERIKKGTVSAETLHSLECKACTLDNALLANPKIQPTGSNEPLIYILGEAPGAEEDKRNVQFIGESGQLLRQHFNRKQLKQIRFNNTIRCRPPKNENPSFVQTACCRPSILKDIESTQPLAIFTFGQVPLTWIDSRLQLKDWRGKYLSTQIGKHACWVFPIYHPAFVLRQTDRARDPLKTRMGKLFTLDINNALAKVDKLDYPAIESPDQLRDNITIITGENGWKDVERLDNSLDKLRSKKIVANDIETNCLRPYTAGAKILSIAFGTYDYTVAIALKHKQAKWTKEQYTHIRNIIYQFLNNKKTKIAHNLAFELEWYLYFFGKQLRRGPWADTMAQAYCLDERIGGLGLDAVCRQHFGIWLKDYAPNVKNLDNEPLEDVLYYNGADSKYTYKIYTIQRAKLQEKGLLNVYNEQLIRIPTLTLTQLKGIEVDQDAATHNLGKVDVEIADLELDIGQEKVVKKFMSERGGFNPGSSNDNIIMFRDYLQSPQVEVKPNKYSTKEDVLEKIDHPLAGYVIRWRKLMKLKSTYIEPYVGDTNKYVYHDGLIHPAFNTVFTESGRTSADNPNIQAIPHREFPWIRRFVVAPKGYILLSVDFGQLEARVIAMMSMDKVLIDALWEKYDIHMEWAERIAYAYPKRIGGKRYINDKSVMKNFRKGVKNEWTFPLFYGARLQSVSEYLKIPETVLLPLYEEFWYMFNGVIGWQQELIDAYEENGFVECMNGRRRHAPLSANKIINTPVQGSASDIVIDAMNRLSETENDIYQSIWNIHDDLSFYIPEKTLDEHADYIVKSMLQCPYKWTKTVPLSVEASIGFNWFETEEIGEYFSNEV